MWAYSAAHPEESEVFDAAIAAEARAYVTGILAAYDFSSFGVIGDIGGGLGHLVQAIIASTPATQGILFDLPHVTEKAKRVPLGRLSLQAVISSRASCPPAAPIC
jgi:hypothetical protein